MYAGVIKVFFFYMSQVLIKNLTRDLSNRTE